jgi:hypothetical protein
MYESLPQPWGVFRGLNRGGKPRKRKLLTAEKAELAEKTLSLIVMIFKDYKKKIREYPC